MVKQPRLAAQLPGSKLTAGFALADASPALQQAMHPTSGLIDVAAPLLVSNLRIDIAAT